MQEHIHLNALKHHLEKIKELVQTYSREQKATTSLAHKLNSIGNRTLDLYLGPLTVSEIKHEVHKLLSQRNLALPHPFLACIEALEGHYFTLDLSDQSTWVLRKSELPGSYIHIHPGRYSVHTIRTHGNALKTALYILCRHPEGLYNIEQIPLKLLNEWRNELCLSPVRSNDSLVKIQRLISLIVKK